MDSQCLLIIDDIFQREYIILYFYITIALIKLYNKY